VLDAGGLVVFERAVGIVVFRHGTAQCLGGRKVSMNESHLAILFSNRFPALPRQAHDFR
jgi:hypothetical protein